MKVVAKNTVWTIEADGVNSYVLRRNGGFGPAYGITRSELEALAPVVEAGLNEESDIEQAARKLAEDLQRDCIAFDDDARHARWIAAEELYAAIRGDIS